MAKPGPKDKGRDWLSFLKRKREDSPADAGLDVPIIPCRPGRTDKEIKRKLLGQKIGRILFRIDTWRLEKINGAITLAEKTKNFSARFFQTPFVRPVISVLGLAFILSWSVQSGFRFIKPSKPGDKQRNVAAQSAIQGKSRVSVVPLKQKAKIQPAPINLQAQMPVQKMQTPKSIPAQIQPQQKTTAAKPAAQAVSSQAPATTHKLTENAGWGAAQFILDDALFTKIKKGWRGNKKKWAEVRKSGLVESTIIPAVTEYYYKHALIDKNKKFIYRSEADLLPVARVWHKDPDNIFRSRKQFNIWVAIHVKYKKQEDEKAKKGKEKISKSETGFKVTSTDHHEEFSADSKQSGLHLHSPLPFYPMARIAQNTSLTAIQLEELAFAQADTVFLDETTSVSIQADLPKTAERFVKLDKEPAYTEFTQALKTMGYLKDNCDAGPLVKNVTDYAKSGDEVLVKVRLADETPAAEKAKKAEALLSIAPQKITLKSLSPDATDAQIKLLLDNIISIATASGNQVVTLKPIPAHSPLKLHENYLHEQLRRAGLNVRLKPAEPILASRPASSAPAYSA